MAGSPYDTVAADRRWSSVANAVARGAAEAQGGVRFTIGPDMAVASAGSCFAGRLADHLRDAGSQYIVAERAPDWLPQEQQFAYGFRPFSARYGLVFTALQMLQLFERAFGTFVPEQMFWESGARFVDPFRPRCAPDGYASADELVADRGQHFAAVRYVFETADVFFFTMGLTEHWRDRRDGAVYPYCPGTAGGTFDPSLHEFHNAGVAENVEALERFITAARRVNPRLKFVLSVSPVPIGATMEAEHVARASTYTKSVLRAAAGEVYRAHDFVDYFAGYELVSQSFFGADPFTEDRRHLKPGVVEDVVRTFRTFYFPDEPPVRPGEGESMVVRDELPCDEDVLAR